MFIEHDNGGGLKRGDREDTGDNQAAPEQDLEPIPSEDIEDLTIVSADDPSLGLTGTPEHPAEDWAADTRPTRTAESS